MEQYKEAFIRFMVESRVLSFGSFTLKSGRVSPFFMNAGAYNTGSQLTRLGEAYAHAIKEHYGLDFDVIFGPAYKGIPLAVIAAEAIHRLYGKEVRYCANRKEEKDHGDKGALLGSPLHDGDRVVIIEDVTTSGKSIEETVPILRAQADVSIIGLMVSLDRQEKGLHSDRGALDEIRETWGFPAHAIVTMEEVVETLRTGTDGAAPVIDVKTAAAIDAYYRQYGAVSKNGEK
ncbi:MAG: orotate phosphoribosyltransferase [Lachnospiraceae bacterium]|nr:orotate phosphoribosyltransferase [Lachnospiraceae bacterium]